VIITIGIFGEADVELVYPPKRERTSDKLPRTREGITIRPGNAYALWGPARWKMDHDAIVGKNEQPIKGMLSETARVGLTLRFCRRSFARNFANMGAVRHHPLLTESQLDCGRTIIDALYYDMDGRRKDEKSYPHTYPALVLEVSLGSLLVLYISDGLTPDDDDEAWSFGTVPIEHAVLASENVVKRCINANGTKAARMTARLIEDIATGVHTREVWRGAADLAQAVRERGARQMLSLLKQSEIVVSTRMG
jgi:hypothetical protein